jgi:cytoplasmic iron level regulating protein YaaA (DUF328/UPF0246 family)
MIIVISPAKALDFKTKANTALYSDIAFGDEAAQLVEEMRKLSPGELGELMKISPNLSELNFTRFHEWQLPFNPKNAKQALLAFNGEVFNGIQAKTLTDEGLEFAQNHLRILSGLYGVLRPLDLIQAYRLEMGTKKSFGLNKNLYEFWSEKVTANLNEELEKQEQSVLINLASNEYFKAIDKKKLNAEVITPQFKQSKDGSYKMIAIFAKKARGLMTRFIIDNDITNPEELKAFDVDGYFFNNELSKGNNWVFTRQYQ